MRCQAGRPLHCSRSCCARRPWTSRQRRIRPLWRSNQSLRPPRRARSSPLLPSTSPHLGSSKRTCSSIRCKCRPRRLPQGQSSNWRKRRRTTYQREPREKPAHSLAEAHHSSSTECSRLRNRRFRAIAVTEPFQQDDSRRDERAPPVTWCRLLHLHHVTAPVVLVLMRIGARMGLGPLGSTHSVPT